MTYNAPRLALKCLNNEQQLQVCLFFDNSKSEFSSERTHFPFRRQDYIVLVLHFAGEFVPHNIDQNHSRLVLVPWPKLGSSSLA
jgi:hypothetical protein